MMSHKPDNRKLMTFKRIHEMRYARTILLASAFMVPAVQAQDWQPVTGEAALSKLVSDTQLEGRLKDGVSAVARYNADGTAVLEAWGGSFERDWRIEDNDKICVMANGEIVEEGDHATLLAAGNQYAHLYNLQFRQQGKKKDDKERSEVNAPAA